jgi:hypothetical protein
MHLMMPTVISDEEKNHRGLVPILLILMLESFNEYFKVMISCNKL